MASQEPQLPQPKPPRSANSGWLVFIIIAMVLAMALLVVLAFGSRSGWWRSDPAGPELRFTPIVGGTRLPTATAVDVAALLATATPSPEMSLPETPSSEPTKASLWIPGASVSVPEEARLYAQPDTSAQVLESYGEGVTFEILEPSGDFDSYPVDAGGVGWIRVRTADGLVGWVTVASVMPVEDPAP